MTGTVDRPVGVTVMAVVAAVAGIADIFAGLGGIGFGGGFLTDIGFAASLDAILAIAGLLLVGVGVLGVVSGYGLWTLRSWAWLIARLWASLGIIVGLVSAGLSLFGATLTSAVLALILGALVPAVAAVVVLWYLYRPEVKAAFGRA